MALDFNEQARQLREQLGVGLGLGKRGLSAKDTQLAKLCGICLLAVTASCAEIDLRTL